jgi:hypothetical protein
MVIPKINFSLFVVFFLATRTRNAYYRSAAPAILGAEFFRPSVGISALNIRKIERNTEINQDQIKPLGRYCTHWKQFTRG